MHLIKIFFGILCFAQLVYAEGQGESATKPESATTEAEYSGKQSQAWSEVQTKLTTMKGKLEAQDAVVKALIAEKAHLTGEALMQKMEQVKKEHQKYQNMANDYNKLNSEYETKFPEKGLKENRVYKRVDPKSIERIEKDMSLDGRMQNIHSKVLKQYYRSAQKIEAEKSKKKKSLDDKKGTTNAAVKDKEKDRLKSKDTTDITEQIILKK